MTLHVPDTDVFRATQRGLEFKVCVKEVPRGRWITLVDGIGIKEAMQNASEVIDKYVETGLLVRTRKGDPGAFIYWTSTAPLGFNSNVLEDGE